MRSKANEGKTKLSKTKRNKGEKTKDDFMKQPKHPLGEYLLIPIGGTAYGLVEVLWRGHTHWTMVLLGGVCFYLIGQIGSHLRLPLYLCAVPCAYVITGLEFLTGCVVNLLLGWNVWDYSSLPMNLLGQVSLTFLGCWYLLSIPALPLATHLKKILVR